MAKQKVRATRHNGRKGENGKFLKHIHFRFPVYYNGTLIDDISWEKGSTVEVVMLLSKSNRKADSCIKLSLDMDEYYEIVDKEASDGE